MVYSGDMRIEKISNSTIEPVENLCSTLKSHDGHPCSFWGHSKEDIVGLVETQNNITLVAMSGLTAAGIGTLSLGGPFQNHWAEISVAVHPKFRKTGVGKQLVLSLEEYRNHLNIEFIKALILENNIPARGFFTKLGFEKNATLYHDFKLENHGNLSDCAYYKIFLST
jgi:ribosomal protein S18 acetylase RimI-like enzyme